MPEAGALDGQKTYPNASLEAVLARSLTEHAYLGREPGSGTHEVIDRYLENTGVGVDSLRVVMEASGPEALKGMVATGLGLTIMSRAAVAKELRVRELVAIPLAPPLIRHLSVVYPKKRIHSRLVTTFVHFAREQFAAAEGRELQVASAT